MSSSSIEQSTDVLRFPERTRSSRPMVLAPRYRGHFPLRQDHIQWRRLRLRRLRLWPVRVRRPSWVPVPIIVLSRVRLCRRANDLWGQPSRNKAMRQRIAGIECRSAPSGEWWIGGFAVDAQRFRSVRGAVGCLIGGPRPLPLDQVSNFAQTTSIDWSKSMLMRPTRRAFAAATPRG